MPLWDEDSENDDYILKVRESAPPAGVRVL